MKPAALLTLHDNEFGIVHVRRMKQAKYIRLRVKGDGELHMTLPYRAAIRHAQELLERSRPHIRKARLHNATKIKHWQDGEVIGSVYTLRVIADETISGIQTLAQSTQAIVRYHPAIPESELRASVNAFAAMLLKKQAMAFLPRRLKALAEQFGFSYNRVRFSSAETRWGSCSSSGTISLNIQLMTLPHELIDYVLIHELCHTKHMNHSHAFWALVEQCLPSYRSWRHALKKYSLV
ncbi:MAG TPA: SprT family zinc-dependent metalloprotease [Candidatus Saccharimonadales bacterium]